MELEVTPDSPTAQAPESAASEASEVFDYEAEWEKFGGTDEDDEGLEEEEDAEDQPADEEQRASAGEGESDGHSSDTSAPEGEEPEANAEELIFGKYKTMEEAYKGFESSQAEAGRLAREAAELKKQLGGKSASADGEQPSVEQPITDEDFVSLLVENPAKAKEVLKQELLNDLPELGLVRQLAAEREAAAWLEETRGKYSEMPEGARFEDFEGGPLLEHINAVSQAYESGQIGEEARDYHLSQGAINQMYLEYANKALIEIAKKPRPKTPTKEELEAKEKLAGSSSTKGKAGQSTKVAVTDPREAFDQEWRNQKKASKAL